MKKERAPCCKVHRSIHRIMAEIGKIAIPVLTIIRLVKDLFKGGNA